MGIIRQVVGVTACIVTIGWAGSKVVGIFTGDTVFIQNTAVMSTSSQVTHNDTGDLTSGLQNAATQSPLSIVEDDVAGPLSHLTPEQLSVVTLLETSSRQMNEQTQTNRNQELYFNHLAVKGLTVRHYYTVVYPYDAVNKAAFMETQSSAITNALCGNRDLRAMIQTLGLSYSYTYVAADQRQVGEFVLTPQSCTG